LEGLRFVCRGQDKGNLYGPLGCLIRVGKKEKKKKKEKKVDETIYVALCRV